MKGPRSFRPEGVGTSSGTPLDFVVEFAKITTSSLDDTSSAVLLNVAGVAGYQDDLTNGTTVADDDGSGIEGAEQFQALGMVGRPLPPRTIDGRDFFTEVVCMKTADGLVPIAFRDLRLQMQGGSAPAEGVIAMVGYGGGFHSMTPVPNGDDPAGGGTIQVLYCPYDFDSNGTAQKAHSVIMDPTTGNESIMVVHADGMAITMGGDEELTLKNADGSTSIVLDADGCKIQGNQIQLNSPKVVIGSPTTAVPLLAGPASPPSSMLFISPAFTP